MTILFDLPLRDDKEEGMERFWINWVVGTDGGRQSKWYNLPLAKAEAERLARLPNVKGKNVYVFECIGKCRVESIPVFWEFPNV